MTATLCGAPTIAVGARRSDTTFGGDAMSRIVTVSGNGFGVGVSTPEEAGHQSQGNGAEYNGDQFAHFEGRLTR